MLLILSPSKTLDTQTPYRIAGCSQPEFLADSKKLVAKLRTFSPAEIARMMEISDKLAALNVLRFKQFRTPCTPENARPALLAFKGDVYEPMEVERYTAKDFAFAAAHLRILSGLYGLLRPLDLMQPYRLEMGRKLAIGKTKDLYGFWGNRLALALNHALATHTRKFIINLASEEYARAVDRRALTCPMLDIIFKEKQGDSLKIIGLHAKPARGAMANFIIKNQIDNVEGLRDFRERGYRFDARLSDHLYLTFVRKAS